MWCTEKRRLTRLAARSKTGLSEALALLNTLQVEGVTRAMKLTEVITTIENYAITYRFHATERMFQRGIGNRQVEYILHHGDIIERYDNDQPLPSVLINGCTIEQRPLHVVVAINQPEQQLVIVTVYEPSILKWTHNFSRRTL